MSSNEAIIAPIGLLVSDVAARCGFSPPDTRSIFGEDRRRSAEVEVIIHAPAHDVPVEAGAGLARKSEGGEGRSRGVVPATGPEVETAPRS